MANSFALTDNGVVLQQPNEAPVGPQITLSGGGGNAPPAATPGLAPGGEFMQHGQQMADMSAKTMNALNTITQGALQPIAERQYMRAYFDGMSQVVQGRALMDIKREQPWYTKIFGPSATVRGAQMLTAMTATAQAQSEFMGAMQELRKQGPDAVRQYLVEQATRLGSTGDVLVDGIVQKKLVEQWGNMLSTHMKQHIAWQQEDMGNKFVSMQVANGQLLQTTLTQQAGFENSEHRQSEIDKFMAGLARPAGMSDEAYGKVVALSAQSQLHNGNFAAYAAMKNAPEVWQAISPEARQSLLDSESLWTQRALRDAPALTAIGNDLTHFQLAVMHGGFTGDESQLHAVIDQFNARFKAENGASRDMINNAERSQLVAQFYKSRAAAASTWEKAQAGLLNDQAQQANVLAALNAGSPALLAPGISEANARIAMEEFWRRALEQPESLDNALSKLALVSDAVKLRPASLESQLRQDAQALFTVGGSVSERQRASLAIMQKLLTLPGGGPHALADYIGADTAARVQTFMNSGVDLDDPKSVEETRKWLKDGAGAHTTREDREAAKDYISSQATSWYQIFTHGALDGLDLNAATKNWMAEELSPYVAISRKAYPGMSDEDAAKFAFAKLYGNPNNADYVDGTLVPKRSYQTGAQSLYAGVRELAGFPISQNSETYQAAVKGVLRDTLRENVTRAVGDLLVTSDDGELAIKQSADSKAVKRIELEDYVAVGGEQLQGGHLLLTYQAPEGQTLPVLVTPQQVWERLKEEIKKPKPPAGVRPEVEQFGASRISNPAHDPLQRLLD